MKTQNESNWLFILEYHLLVHLIAKDPLFFSAEAELVLGKKKKTGRGALRYNGPLQSRKVRAKSHSILPLRAIVPSGTCTAAQHDCILPSASHALIASFFVFRKARRTDLRPTRATQYSHGTHYYRMVALRACAAAASVVRDALLCLCTLPSVSTLVAASDLHSGPPTPPRPMLSTRRMIGVVVCVACTHIVRTLPPPLPLPPPPLPHDGAYRQFVTRARDHCVAQRAHTHRARDVPDAERCRARRPHDRAGRGRERRSRRQHGPVHDQHLRGALRSPMRCQPP